MEYFGALACAQHLCLYGGQARSKSAALGSVLPREMSASAPPGHGSPPPLHSAAPPTCRRGTT
eukprot:6881844-Pyramimonas_sp.AAC.1